VPKDLLSQFPPAGPLFRLATFRLLNEVEGSSFPGNLWRFV
jgi:hypothetical protein